MQSGADKEVAPLTGMRRERNSAVKRERDKKGPGGGREQRARALAALVEVGEELVALLPRELVSQKRQRPAGTRLGCTAASAGEQRALRDRHHVDMLIPSPKWLCPTNLGDLAACAPKRASHTRASHREMDTHSRLRWAVGVCVAFVSRAPKA